MDHTNMLKKGLDDDREIGLPILFRKAFALSLQ